MGNGMLRTVAADRHHHAKHHREQYDNCCFFISFTSSFIIYYYFIIFVLNLIKKEGVRLLFYSLPHVGSITNTLYRLGKSAAVYSCVFA